MIEKPRKGEGLWRHCYIGQEDKLMTLLHEKGLSIEQFNQVWDAIAAEEAREQIHGHEYARRLNPPPNAKQITRLP
jgi:hypothetical protein